MTPPDLRGIALQQCESERLHLSGAIQAFGALICIDSATATVTHASANLADYVGVGAPDLLGKSARDLSWLPEFCLSALRGSEGDSGVFQSQAGSDLPSLEGRVIRGNGCIIVELEKSTAASDPLSKFAAYLPAVPYDEDELEGQHQALVQAFRDISGYGRVMVYRFHPDWAGEVIAEASGGAFGSYLGLRFPASDIPEIARKLYMINPCRLIPDSRAAPVAILGLTGTPPDLTWSDLRSVSPVHLDYLDNMGVAAAFSVPIRVNRRLWGLVACHHDVPYLLSPDRRLACVSLTNSYSMALSSYFASRSLQLLDSLDRRVDGIMGVLAQHDEPLDGVREISDRLMDSMAAQAFAMAVGQDVVIFGEGPDLETMGLIDQWFMNECNDPSIMTDHLEDIFPGESLLLAQIRGMVAIKGHSLRSGWVRFYWFRPAQPQEIAWAGNPDKPLIERAGVLTLSPRRSFEKWIELRSGYSRAWSNEEKLIAAKYRTRLLQWL